MFNRFQCLYCHDCPDDECTSIIDHDVIHKLNAPPSFIKVIAIKLSGDETLNKDTNHKRSRVNHSVCTKNNVTKYDVSSVISNKNNVTVNDVSTVTYSENNVNENDISSINSNENNINVNDASCITSNENNVNVNDVSSITSEDMHINPDDISNINDGNTVDKVNIELNDLLPFYSKYRNCLKFGHINVNSIRHKFDPLREALCMGVLDMYIYF